MNTCTRRRGWKGPGEAILGIAMVMAPGGPGAAAPQGIEDGIPPVRVAAVAHGPGRALGAEPIVVIGDASLRDHGIAWGEFLWRLTGSRPSIVSGRTTVDAAVYLHLDPEMVGDEAYRIEPHGGLHVFAGTVEGMARGTATLLQLIEEVDGNWVLPGLGATLEDHPESDYRAVMVDVARQPHGIETLRHLVDLLYLYKVRYLHVHLTDDQAFTFPFEPVTGALTGNRTIPLEDWKGLVAHAESLGIAVIPELDLPGHSTKLKRSGYLEDPTPDTPFTDADVAHPSNHGRIMGIVDAMNEVFTTSPYFHIGGDESSAGETLIPFLAATNEHLRSASDPSERRRLLVWEGFGGRPEEIPATGDDRVIVMGWESHYNAPWNLLGAGYEVINASWKPLYVVGGGTPRLPHIGGRSWSGREIHRWSKDEFWHWQPGTPVFEDRGPADPNRNDGIWPVPEAWRSQVLGGQLLFWEQREWTVLRDSWERVPALAERLWSGARPGARDEVGFQRRMDTTGERMRGLVQPLRMTVEGGVDPSHPTSSDFVWFDGSVDIAFESKAHLGGSIHYTLDGSTPTSASSRFEEAITLERAAQLRARLFVEGQGIGAEIASRFDPRPARVRSTWFKLPRRPLAHVPDFDDRSRWTPLRSDLLPELRGPYRTHEPIGQVLEGTFVVPEARAGVHSLRLQTRDGRARLYVDGKPVLGPSEPSEVKLFAELDLAPGPHSIRVHHASGAISPVVIVAVKLPGAERFVDISPLLAEIGRSTEPEALGPPTEPVDLLARGLGDWHFVSPSATDRDEVVELTDEGVLKIAGRPTGYLETQSWYRDYELEFQWRWPEGSRGGNSGLLVHVTTPRLFYGWPRSLEVQLQAGSAGDFWTIGAGVDLTVENAATRRVRPRPGDLHSHRRIPRMQTGAEHPLGEWNQMRVRCDGDQVVVYVNGIEVNRGLDATVRQGAIALQSEGAPIEFRNILLRPLTHRAP